MTTEIVTAERTTIARYSPIEAGISALKEKHLNVVIDVTTPEGMRKAKEGRKELQTVRINLDKARKEEKEESLRYGRLVDAEAKRIQEVLTPMEEAYDRAIKAEEKRIQDEIDARVKAEKEAEEAKQRAIREEEERVRREEMAKIEAEKAELARKEAALKAETEEREKQLRLKIEEEQKKLDEQKRAFEADQKAIRDRQEEEQRKIREAQEKIRLEEEEKTRKIEAEKRAEREKIEAEERAARLKKEEEERQARLIKEEEERKVMHEKMIRMDARNYLKTFVGKYGGIEEFSPICSKINEFLDSTKG